MRLSSLLTSGTRLSVVAAALGTLAISARAESLYALSYSGTLYRIQSNGSYAVIASSIPYPSGLAVDNSGNAFVADQLNSRIYKFTPSGVKTVYATVPGFDMPSIVFDAAGSLYVSENDLHDIRKIAADGTQSIFASGLQDPTGLAIDVAGNLYEADNLRGKINKFSSEGVNLLTLTVPDAFKLAFDSSSNLLVTRFHQGDVLRIQPNGSVTSLASELNTPYGMSIGADDSAYISEGFTTNIDRIAPNGSVSTFVSMPEGIGNLAFGPDAPITSTPEPSGWALLASGLCTVGGILRHRRKRMS